MLVPFFFGLVVSVCPALPDPGVAPYLQPAGQHNGGAVRGVLGECEDDHSLYHGFVPEGEPYHCNMGAAEVEFKKKYYPNEELCDWGFGELIPKPNFVNGSFVWGPPGPEYEEAPGTAPGTTAPEKMYPNYMCVAGGATVGGSTGGRVNYQSLCNNGALKYCLPRYYNLSLAWPSSMGIYRITEGLANHIDMWRAVYHRPNIAFGVHEKYYAGWVRKVVRCSDIPRELLKLPKKMASADDWTEKNESSIEYAVRAWRAMDSLITDSNLTASFVRTKDWSAAPIKKVVHPSASISIHNGQVHLNMSAGEHAWFGIGFNATMMSDLPNAVVVDGNGAITERKLATYQGGEELKLQWKELSHTVENGIRTVLLTRAASSSDSRRFSFPVAGGTLKVIWAVGLGADYSTHGLSGTTTLQILVAPSPIYT